MDIYLVVAGFILFDIITGLIKAGYKGEINSTNLRRGLYHKLSEIVTVAGCGLLDYYIKYLQTGFDVPILKPVATYICIMEAVSIVENISQVNEKLGNFLKPYLEKLKGERDGNSEEGN